MYRVRLLFAAALLLSSLLLCHSQVVVSKTSAEKLTLDLSGFTTGSRGMAPLFVKTLKADLARSGWFEIVARGQGAITVVGSYEHVGKNLEVNCSTYNAVTKRKYMTESFWGAASEARRLAHEVSDAIVEAVTGRKGMSDSKLVFIGNRTRHKEVYTCDADGMNVKQMTHDRSICMSPSWGPSGNRLVYTSFRAQFPDVYLVDMKTFKRERIARFPGLNNCADISPDGRFIALTLSKDGNPEIYIMDLRSRKLTRRLTKTPNASESSPSWSPDGKQIVFVSDTAGSPHLYIVSVKGGARKRITYTGSENVEPDWGPDGRILYSSKRLGRYEICIYDPQRGDDSQLTKGDADYEDPCWAPDGRHIACARLIRYQSSLYLLDTMGDAPVRLVNLGGDVHSPSWISN